MTRTPIAIPPHDLDRADRWAGALYGKPKGRIIGEREGQPDDRSTSSEVFDLQLIDGSRSGRSKFPGAVLASSITHGDWIETLLDD